MKGTEIVGRVWSLSIPEREDAFVQAVIDGDAVPWPMVDVKVASPDGRHSGAFQISADYLSIGTTSDFIRIPLTPLSAQRICDILGFSLPTTKMVDLAWKQASVRLAPQPMGPPYDATMGSMARIAEHNARVETQRAGRTGLVRGHKKDVVLTNQLAARPRQVAIYGWHQSNGTPIQSLTLVHTNTYMDYSHGIALIGKTMVLDGGEVDIAEVLSDPELAPLLSDEGVLKVLRQPGVGDSDAPRDKPAPSAPPGEAPPWLQPELSIGARAVEWSLHELSSGVHEEPPGSNAGPRIQEYLAPCVRDGKNLGLTSGNWCAASASAAAFACKLPGETVPHEYRAAGLDMEKDAKSNGSWRAASDALRGAFSPAVGDLVILQRGSKTGSDSWKRHVARVETPPDAEGRYRTIGGNEGAGEWHLSERRFVDPDLLGFIVYPRARDASSPVAIPPATPPGLPAGPVAQRLDIGAPGADSLMFVTSKPSGSGATLIDLATGVFGRPPAFWGRYFSKPSVQPQKDGRVTGEYWPEKETEALLAAGICLLPIARQTKRVNLTQEDGRADGRENAQALVSKVGAAHLGSSGAEIYMFLDIEASDTSPSLSADYFIGWARGLSEGSNGVKIAPCLYMRQADGATVRALNAASARGTQCRAIWMAHWLGRKQYTPDSLARRLHPDRARFRVPYRGVAIRERVPGTGRVRLQPGEPRDRSRIGSPLSPAPVARARGATVPRARATGRSRACRAGLRAAPPHWRGREHDPEGLRQASLAPSQRRSSRCRGAVVGPAPGRRRRGRAEPASPWRHRCSSRGQPPARDAVGGRDPRVPSCRVRAGSPRRCARA
jgi:hypothetical protein